MKRTFNHREKLRLQSFVSTNGDGLMMASWHDSTTPGPKDPSPGGGNGGIGRSVAEEPNHDFNYSPILRFPVGHAHEDPS